MATSKYQKRLKIKLLITTGSSKSSSTKYHNVTVAMPGISSGRFGFESHP